MKELIETMEQMISDDYKERFKAEYTQVKTRYEKLKHFNNRISAYESLKYSDKPMYFPLPKYDCPRELLREQEEVMRRYIDILELRAIIEGIEI